MTFHILAGLGGMVAASPGLAEWRLTGYGGVTGTYTSNVDFTVNSLAQGDFVTSITGGLNIAGEGGGKRLKVNGSIGASQALYIGQAQNNTFAPSVNLTAKLEAIENFAFVDAQANITPTFQSPFGAQPADPINATNNRYVQSVYTVSPRIQGVLGSSGMTYQVRNDNTWTFSGNYGNSTADVPSTYSNALTASLNSPGLFLGWSLEYSRFHFQGDDIDAPGATEIGGNSYTTQSIRLIVPVRATPQVQLSARLGYEGNQFPLTDSTGVIYGISGKWSPTERTQIEGFWEHRFFGASYSAQISHRLPNSALSASFSRGLTSYPELALSIPANASVSQFVNAAFTTRIPDPAERALAVEQFLARSGLPATLASPVNFYSQTAVLQQSGSASLVLIGMRNTVSFSLFHVTSYAISGKGDELPQALQFGQNNTQTGVSATYNRSLGAQTSLGANATYSRTTLNNTTGPLADARSSNANFGLNLSTQIGRKTSATAGLSYSSFDSPGAATTGKVSSLNAFAGVTYTFF